VVYVCTNDNTLYTLDARTGLTKWSKSAPKGSDPFGYSSPIVSGGTIYIAGLGDNGDVYALSTSGGEQKWRTPTGQTVYDSSVKRSHTPTSQAPPQYKRPWGIHDHAVATPNPVTHHDRHRAQPGAAAPSVPCHDTTPEVHSPTDPSVPPPRNDAEAHTKSRAR